MILIKRIKQTFFRSNNTTGNHLTQRNTYSYKINKTDHIIKINHLICKISVTNLPL